MSTTQFQESHIPLPVPSFSLGHATPPWTSPPPQTSTKQIPAEMATPQRGHWNSMRQKHRTSLVDNKDPKRKSISFHERPAYSASWSPATEFSERVAESRSLQLRKLIDPRGYLNRTSTGGEMSRGCRTLILPGGRDQPAQRACSG